MKKIAIFTIALLMLIGVGTAFINRVEAAKPIQAAHKESVKADNDRETNGDCDNPKENAKVDNDRETNDDCDKCEQDSNAINVSEQNRKENCQQEKEDSDQEQGDEASDKD